jgi:small-conductance mechanosensitive channel
MQPHRGVLILVLGILGLLLCQLLGPVAWVLGKGDLRAMDAGQMDPEGRGLTQAGYILGIVATAFMVLSLFAFLAIFVLGVGSAIVEQGISDPHPYPVY